MRRRPPISTTAPLLLALLVAACGQSAAKPLETSNQTTNPPPGAPAPAPAPAQSTTSAPPKPIWPLTGMPLVDAAAAKHPALVVKIDNSPDARPHTGLNQADLVYELKVEGITRFATVFHSQESNPVGPVRSARSSDIDLLWNLMRPLLLWSGGNPGVTGEVKDAESKGVLIDVSHTVGVAHYFRDNRRVAPHNLYANMTEIRQEFTPPDAGTPLPLFTYRDMGVAPPASAVDNPGTTVDFGGGVKVDFVWDAERGCWDRFQVDQSHPRSQSAFVDSDGRQVCQQNVVIMYLDYGVSEADARSPKALSLGTGSAIVLSGGKMQRGQWKRDLALAGWGINDGAGKPIDLAPGATAIELPASGGPGEIPLDPAAAAEIMQYRA